MPDRREKPEESRSTSGPLGGHLPLETETVWFLFVSALDVFMTYLLLRQPGYTEGNPIALYFLRHWGVRGMVYFKFFLVALVCLITQVIARTREDIARRVLQLAIVVVSGVVTYSLILYLSG